MNSQQIVQLLIIGVLLLCGFLFFFRYLKNNLGNRVSLPVLIGISLVFYGLMCGMLIFILHSMGSLNYVFLSVLMLSSCVTGIGMVAYLVRNFSKMKKGALVLFAVYLLAVAYITIFSRNNNAHSISVLVGFSSLQEALEAKSLQPLRHMLLNVIMFIPLGFLLPLSHPSRLDKLLIVVPICALLSVMIESIQLILGLGQCDVEDLVANTLGGGVGLLLYWIYARLFHQYAVEDDDDEEEEEEE